MGCTPEALRKWVRRSERDEGKHPWLTADERQLLKDQEHEIRELKRANEITCHETNASFQRPGCRSATTNSDWRVLTTYLGDQCFQQLAIGVRLAFERESSRNVVRAGLCHFSSQRGITQEAQNTRREGGDVIGSNK